MAHRKTAGTLLRYPDGSYAFQRRDNAGFSPNMLGLFGGQMEPGETPEQAVKRELREETALMVESLNLRLVLTLEIPAQETSRSEAETLYLFCADIPDEHFEVYEGTGTERYALDSLLERDDISKVANYTLTKYRES
jgi:8-oxo-dGTP pyrophosphatase MutT (NUDIX family)